MTSLLHHISIFLKQENNCCIEQRYISLLGMHATIFYSISWTKQPLHSMGVPHSLTIWPVQHLLFMVHFLVNQIMTHGHKKGMWFLLLGCYDRHVGSQYSHLYVIAHQIAKWKQLLYWFWMSISICIWFQCRWMQMREYFIVPCFYVSKARK